MGKLQHIQHQINAINHLIKINNNRIAGYNKILKEPEVIDHSKIFEQHILESKQNAAELMELIQTLGGQATSGASFSNKIYNTWFDLKAKIKKRSEKAILNYCEYGEEVANTAYRVALDDKELIWEDKKVVSALSDHLKNLKKAQEKIKGLKDAVLKT